MHNALQISVLRVGDDELSTRREIVAVFPERDQVTLVRRVRSNVHGPRRRSLVNRALPVMDGGCLRGVPGAVARDDISIRLGNDVAESDVLLLVILKTHRAQGVRCDEVD